jgi:hypothetical protein
MLEGYLLQGFEKSCTNALVRGIKEGEFERGTAESMQDTVERSLKLHKDEGKQLFHVANFIRKEVEHEWENIVPKLTMTPSAAGMDPKTTRCIDNLKSFLEDIVYYKVDYYEAAKQLTKYYKENQKKQLKKVV